MDDLPLGFEAIADGSLRMVVRADRAGLLAGLLRQWASGTLPAGRLLAGGRGGVGAYVLAPDLSVVLRPCRRGGFVRRWNRDLYWGWRPRPFRELLAAESLRARGVPTVEMLAAAVRWVVPGCCYRGAVVTREVPQAVNLWEYLRAVDPDARARACLAAAAVTRRLHDIGAIHPDLNLQNYLVRPSVDDPDVLVIDCDGVRLRPVTPADRAAAFERLCRSMRRLDPSAAVLTLACVDAFHTITRCDSPPRKQDRLADIP